jgi:hypothetical protein
LVGILQGCRLLLRDFHNSRLMKLGCCWCKHLAILLLLELLLSELHNLLFYFLLLLLELLIPFLVVDDLLNQEFTIIFL